MERLEPPREKLLFAILRLIDDETLSDVRFGATEVRTFGGVWLLLFEHGPGGSQPKLEGYVFSDLRALARAGLVDVDERGKSADVTVLRAAYRYRDDYPSEAEAEGARGESKPTPTRAKTNAHDDRASHGVAQRPREAAIHDAFVSHASSDKEAVARPLANELHRLGYDVWFDEWTLRIGDSLRQTIDDGLRRSRYGIVILSPAFFSRRWPQTELDGLVAREALGEKVVLPVWHELGFEEVLAYSPILAAKVAGRTTVGIPALARELALVLGGRAPRKTHAPRIPAPSTDFREAPMLRWLDPSARLVGLGPSLEVWCENSGYQTSTAVVLRRWAEMNRADGSGQWEPLEFAGFNVPSFIHSIHGGDPQRRFLVRMHAERHARELGPLRLRWSVLYKDNDMVHGYLTSASLVAHFDSPSAAHLSEIALDATSNARERNQRYLAYVAEHGEPST